MLKRLFQAILDPKQKIYWRNSDLDFTDKGRVENIRRIGEVANLFVDAGLVVLSAFVAFRSVLEICSHNNLISVSLILVLIFFEFSPDNPTRYESFLNSISSVIRG